MSFFSDRPQQEPAWEEEPERELPPWFGAPTGVLPGLLADRVVLGRTDRVLMTIDQFRAYPTGVEFSLNLWIRHRADQIYDFPWETRRHPRAPGADESALLRFGFQFSDGSSWTNVDRRSYDFDQQPDGPVLNGGSGGGGDDHWYSNRWMWPLPPPGDVTFVASWPALELPETTAVIAGKKFIDAAATAEVIWD